MATIPDDIELLKLRVSNLEKYIAMHFPGVAQTYLLADEIDASGIADKVAAKTAMAVERGKHK